jgi:hypothetical protein
MHSSTAQVQRNRDRLRTFELRLRAPVDSFLDREPERDPDNSEFPSMLLDSFGSPNQQSVTRNLISNQLSRLDYWVTFPAFALHTVSCNAIRQATDLQIRNNG